MAYSTITDTEILPGKPGSNALFTKLRDNPIGIAAGSSGAPKIADAAFSPGTINGDKLVANSVTASQIAPDAVGQSELANNSVDLAAMMLLSVDKSKLRTITSSLAGAITPGGGGIDILMAGYCFFPMIHTSSPQVYLSGRSTDYGNPDQTSFRLYNASGSGQTYDVDYRAMQ